MKKVHFIGISGTGMSAVAKLMKERGWQISGSDEGAYPPVSTYLEENGLSCLTPYSPKNIPTDVDLIVIGKHATLVPAENQEVKAAFSLGVPVKSFPDILNELTEKTQNWVVVGSFGKSTSSILTAWTLSQAGKDPSYFVAALSPSLASNAHLGSGPYFVLEGDEYPSSNWDTQAKFLRYNASSVLFISAEHDHLNVFPTLESYLRPFVQLLSSLSPDALVLACLDGENVEAVLDKSARSAITYSLDNRQADWWAENIRLEEITSFDLISKGENLGRLTSSLLGEHNVQNMVGVAAWLLENKAVTFVEIAKAFQSFAGIRRRLERKTKSERLPVYEDFGSSRAKAQAGLKTIRQQFPHRRLIVIFEPHTFSFRNRDSLPWYDTLFSQADLVFIFVPPQSGADSHAQLSHQEIVERVQATGIKVYPVRTKSDVIEKLREILRPDKDLILIETSGDLDGAIPEIVALAERVACE